MDWESVKFGWKGQKEWKVCDDDEEGEEEETEQSTEIEE